MPTDSTQTVKDILHSAKMEFIKQGYAGASLRDIAAGAGVTTGALYRHFKDKEALFEAVVEPTYTAFLRRYAQMSEDYFRQLEEEGIAAMWGNSTTDMEIFVGDIYNAFDVFKLLLTGSEQTPYEHFVHSLVDMGVDTTFQYIEMARKLGYPVRQVSREEMHILSSAQYSCVFEMVLHDMPKEDALALTKSLGVFFAAGWHAILMEPET